MSASATLAAASPFAPHFHELPQGQSLHYLDEGPRAAEPVLCLHGNPSWSFYYRSLVSGLSDRWRVLVPDHIGCGLSDKPGDARYRLEQHVANLESLVLGLDLCRLTLVLHDWGGAIGMGLAARYPERIARLVILNTAAFRSKRIPWRIAVCRWPLLGELFLLGGNAFVRSALHMAVGKPLGPELKQAYLAPFPDWSSRKAQLAFVRDIPMSPRHPSWSTLSSIEQALPRFATLPIAIVWGERDWCFTRHFREQWQRIYPAAEVHRLESAGHWLIEDEPLAATAIVRSFLERHPLP